MRKLKRDFFEKRQNRPSGIRFTGVLPPSTIYKNSKNIERTLFWCAKIKTRSLSKNVKKTLRNTFIRGPPPSTIYKNSKNIERTLIWCAKIKTRTFSKNVKIDPQEYVYQGSPPLLSQNLQKHRKNPDFMFENLNTNFVEKRQNRPSGIRLSGVPPSTIYKKWK